MEQPNDLTSARYPTVSEAPPAFKVSSGELSAVRVGRPVRLRSAEVDGRLTAAG